MFNFFIIRTIMENLKKLMLAFACLLVPIACVADDRPISPDQLPAEARSFVQTHFSGKKIVYAEKDWNSYECRLNDGTQVEFNRKGVWTEVDCHMAAIPAAIIPAAMQDYVKKNFEGCLITKIAKERYGYEVELSNDLDLKFNYQGALIGIDD